MNWRCRADTRTKELEARAMVLEKALRWAVDALAVADDPNARDLHLRPAALRPWLAKARAALEHPKPSQDVPALGPERAPSPTRFSRADGMEVAGGCAVLLEFAVLLWFVLLWFGR